MIVAGLTGSIGMGKSTVLAMFADAGAAVWSADAAVHRLYAKGGAGAKALKRDFSHAIVKGAIDRARLSKIVLADPRRLAALEAIVHPLVAADRARFVEEARARGAEVAILDIPLLFEKGYESGFDAVIVVSAPADVQRARVLARASMTPEKFASILAKQTPDAEKRARADHVIDTGQSLDATRADVEALMARIAGTPDR